MFISDMPPHPIKLKLKKNGDGTYKIIDPPAKKRRKLIELKTWNNTGPADLIHVFNKFKSKIYSRCIFHLNNDQAIKFYITVKVQLEKIDFKTGESQIETAFFHSGTKMLLHETQFEEVYTEGTLKMFNSFDTWIRNGSGYRLRSIDLVQLSIFKYNPIGGTTYIPTPKCILRKHCVVNVKNKDNMCFIWSILCGLFSKGLHHPSRPREYVKFLPSLKFDRASMPMKVEQISQFERDNDLPVNVYYIKENGKRVFPLRITKMRFKPPIHLLLIVGETHNHYTWISRFDVLLSHHTLTTRDPKTFCPYCLHGFVVARNGRKNLEEHKLYCSEVEALRVELPKDDRKTIKFKDYSKALPVPFVIYSDFESFLTPIKTQEKFQNTGEKIKLHDVSGFSYTIVSPFYETKTFSYCGPDAGVYYLKCILEEGRRLQRIIDDDKDMEELSPSQLNEFKVATRCHICKENFEEGQLRAKDHCHMTGRYRGPSHIGCNLLYRKSRAGIPVFLHNLAGYDGHVIFKALAKLDTKHNVSVLARSMENFISFQIGGLIFKDTFQFMPSSLDKLVSQLKVQGTEDGTLKTLFSHTYNYFQKKWKHLPPDAFEFLTCKGVYPYDYMNGPEKLNETVLPPKEKYFNTITGKHITDEEYEFAQNLFKTFELKSLLELHVLYNESDTTLLADVFENFRKHCLKSFSLDPAHFHTSPSLTWSAALKHTKVELELVTDIDMSLFIDRSIIGGISLISNRYARANDPNDLEVYNDREKKSYLKLFDVNNLYGYGMRQPLPTGNFSWETENSTVYWENILNTIEADSSVGYIFEVDLDYPPELHELHDSFPLAPEHVEVTDGMLSEYQRELARNLDIKMASRKLCLTLNHKKNYICYHMNLKLYLELGMKLRRVHRVLSFKQSTWLRSYIDLCTNLRQNARSKFEENFFKLMINAFFGRC